MKTLITALTITAMSASTAFANISFTEADVTGDGVVSAGELVKANLQLKQFRVADANGDRQWTVEEFNSVKQFYNADNIDR